MLADDPQRLFGVEPRREHQGPAGGQHHAAESQRGGVVGRGGRVVDGVLVEPEERAEDRDERLARLVDLPVAQRRLDALRAAGGARGVEHVRARGLVARFLGARGGDRVLVGVVARDGPAERQPAADLRRLVDESLGELGLVRRDDDHLGAAVVDDVGGLGPGEVVVDRGDVEPGADRGPVGDEHVRAVGRDQRDVAAAFQALAPQHVREADRPLLELGVGEGLPRVGHHDGGLVGVRPRVVSGVHGAGVLIRVGRRVAPDSYPRHTALTSSTEGGFLPLSGSAVAVPRRG